MRVGEITSRYQIKLKNGMGMGLTYSMYLKVNISKDLVIQP